MSRIMWQQTPQYPSKSELTCYTSIKTKNKITIKIKGDKGTHKNCSSQMKFSDASLNLGKELGISVCDQQFV